VVALLSNHNPLTALSTWRRRAPVVVHAQQPAHWVFFISKVTDECIQLLHVGVRAPIHDLNAHRVECVPLGTPERAANAVA